MNVTQEHHMPITEVIQQSVLITLIPAAVMFLAGIVTIFWPRPPSKNLAHAIQHLAAGILLSAIALELIPPIAEAHQRLSIVGMVVGFSCGAAVMVTLPMVLDEEEAELEMSEAGHESPALTISSGTAQSRIHEPHSLRHHQACDHADMTGLESDNISAPAAAEFALDSPPASHPLSADIEAASPARQPASPTPSKRSIYAAASAHAHGETVPADGQPAGADSPADSDGKPLSPRSSVRARTFQERLRRGILRRARALRRMFRCHKVQGDEEEGRARPEAGAEEAGAGPDLKFPSVFAAAVMVDSLMDGLLVGISLITGPSAGVFMAVAMASEMGFLGLSFATALVPLPRWQSIPAVCSGPACMLIGAVVGGSLADALSVNEPLLVGCTSFGVAALLYMVTEELLVSAHEDGFGHTWWVDIQVFVGFLIAMVIGKLLEVQH